MSPMMTQQLFVILLQLILLLFPLHIHALSQGSNQASDFRYMEVVYNGTDLPFSEEYEYVVVGGGTTGCSLAATLSEEHSVLLLERGKPPLSYPLLLTRLNFPTFDFSQYATITRGFSTEEGVEVESSSVLGGSSWTDLSPYSRASPEFFRSTSDSVKWDMGSVEEAYEWVERDSVSFPSGPLDYWQSTARDAFLEAGIVPDNGFALDYRLGTKIAGTFFDRFGRKRGADQLLNKAEFSNLRIGVEANVERIFFSADESEDRVPKARGVIYTDLHGYSHRVFARREVILSASALGSPTLMLLSGIGPEFHLSSHRIQIVHPQPSIGSFMSDNPRITASLLAPFPLSSPEAGQIVGITEDYVVRAESSSFLAYPNPMPFSNFPKNARSARLRLLVVASLLTHPKSRGTLRLGSSTNASAPPKVRFNYFSDPEDLSKCGDSARKIAEILNTTSISGLKYEDLQGGTGFRFYGATFPTDNYTSGDSTFEDYCRNTFTTSLSYLGGCVVGKVLDARFRVTGIRGLRVVDSSAFATSSGPNPIGTGMMLGRYVGQQMLREARDTTT